MITNVGHSVSNINGEFCYNYKYDTIIKIIGKLSKNISDDLDKMIRKMLDL